MRKRAFETSNVGHGGPLVSPAKESIQLAVKGNHEDAIEELKNEFLGEFQHMQKHVHRLMDDLAAISGYAQIVQVQLAQSAAELEKIIHTVEKSMLMLRSWVANLKELEQRCA
jgi:antirestriction protein ArdC